MERDTKQSKSKIVIAILALIILCLGGFIVYDKVLKKTDTSVEEKKEQTDLPKEEVLSIYDSLVQQLYGYVTYNRLSVSNNSLFISTQRVFATSMTDEQKILYATQFLSESDYHDTGKKTEHNMPLYEVSKEKILQGIEKMFGKNVTVNPNVKIQYLAPSTWNLGGSGVTLEYNSASNNYLATFAGIGGAVMFNAHNAKLMSAVKKGDMITLTEKIIYFNVSEQVENDGSFKVDVYQDIAQQQRLDTVTIAGDKMTLPVEDYLEQAGEITYTFEKDNSGDYHFIGSQIMK